MSRLITLVEQVDAFVDEDEQRLAAMRPANRGLRVPSAPAMADGEES